MDINFTNHIEALDSAILIDRKHGDCFQLRHISRGLFIARHTTKNFESAIGLRKIGKGLSIRRYRILEVKN